MRHLLDNSNVWRNIGVTREDEVRINYVPHQRLVRNAIREADSEFDAEHIILVECRKLRDSGAHDRPFRKHNGSNPHLMEEIFGSHGIDDIIREVDEQLSRVSPRVKVAIVFICAKGTHRSESLRHLFDGAF